MSIDFRQNKIGSQYHLLTTTWSVRHTVVFTESFSNKINDRNLSLVCNCVCDANIHAQTNWHYFWRFCWNSSIHWVYLNAYFQQLLQRDAVEETVQQWANYRHWDWKNRRFTFQIGTLPRACGYKKRLACCRRFRKCDLTVHGHGRVYAI